MWVMASTHSVRKISPRNNRDSVTPHSVRSDFTGFDSAAFIAWKLIVNKAMNIANTAATMNTHQFI